MASKKIFTSLAFQSGAKLVAPKVETITPEANLTTPTNNNSYYTGSAGQLAYNNGNIWVNNDSIWTKLLNHKTSATISGGFTFDRVDGNNAGIAPFIIGSSSNNKLVAGLNAAQLNGREWNEGVVGDTIVSRDGQGRIKAATPTADDYVATKGYVDGVAQGLTIIDPCYLATTVALPNHSYNNGTNGVGATMTASANGALSIDGNAVSNGKRILVKDQANNAHNGIYTVTNAGSGSAAFVLTRATDYDEQGELLDGDFVFVQEGTVNANRGFVQTSNFWTATTGTVGTHSITWTQFSGAGQITVTSTKGSSSSTGPLIKTGDTIDFGFNATSFDVDSNSNLRIAEGGVVSSRLADDAVTPAKLQDTGSFTMGGLLVGSASEWTDNPAAETATNLYVSLQAGVNRGQHDPRLFHTNDIPQRITTSSTNTDGPDSLGLVLHNDSTTAGSYSPMLAFSHRENASPSPYKATMAAIYARTPTGTGTANDWIDGELIFATGGATSYGIESKMVLDKNGKLVIGEPTASGTLHVSTARYGSHLITGDKSDYSVADGSASSSQYGWSLYGNNTSAISSEQLVITQGGGTNAELVAYYYFTTSNPYSLAAALVVGRKYKVSISLKYTGTAAPSVRINDGVNYLSSFATLTTSLTTYTTTFEAKHASSAFIAFTGLPSGGTVTIDNLTLQEDSLASATGSDFAVADDLVINNGLTQAGMTLLGSGGARIHFGESGKEAHSRIIGTYDSNKDSSLFFAASNNGTAATVMTLFGNDKSAKFEGGLGVGTTESAAGTITVKANGGRINVRSNDNLVALLGNWGNSNSEDQNEGYLALYGAGAEKIRIAANYTSYFNGGNVAIGATSADEKLHVVGNVILRGANDVRLKIANNDNNNWAEIGNEGGSTKNTLDFYTASSSTPCLSLGEDDTHDHKANSIINSATVAGLQDSVCYYIGAAGDAIDTGYGNGLQGENRSYSIWVKLDDALSNDQMVFASVNGTNQRLYVGVQSDKWVFGIASSSWNSGATGAVTAVSGKWTHVVLTIGTQYGKLYVDGVLTIESNFGAGNVDYDLASNIFLGKQGTGSSYVAHGSYRDFKVIASELDAADIRKLYSGENPKKNNNVLIYEEDTADDSTGNWGNDTNTTTSHGSGIYTLTNTAANYSGTWTVNSMNYIAVTAGKTYKASFKVKDGTTTGVGVKFGLRNAASSYQFIAEKNDIVTTSEFVEYSIIGTALSGMSTAYIYIRVEGNHNIGFTDVTLEEVGTLVDFTPQSASSTKWRNEALLGLYDGAVNNATLSQGNSYWNNIKQSERNVSIGVGLEDWQSSRTALQIGGNGSLNATASQGAGGHFDIAQNAYINSSGSWAYINTDEASLYNQVGGAHNFKVKSSGTADTAISWATGLTVENDGDVKTHYKLGVGGTASSCQLRVAGTSEFEDSIFLGDHQGVRGLISWSGAFDSGLGSGNEHVHMVLAGSNSAQNAGILFKTRHGSNHVDAGVVSATGNWGLRSTKPQALLDINSTANTGYPLLIRGDLDGAGRYTGIKFGLNGTGNTSNYFKAAIQVRGTSGYVQPDMHFMLEPAASWASVEDSDAHRVLSLRNDGTHDHQGNRIVNSQTVNDSWRTSEPSLRFDGVNDFVDVGSIDAGHTFTFSCWFKTTTTENFRMFVNVDGATNDNPQLRINGGKVQMRAYARTGVTTSADYNDGKWHHAVGGRNGSNKFFLYVDGVDQGTADWTQTPVWGTVRFGKYIASSTYYYEGEIKDVRIHNRALEADEIKGLYNGESTAFSDTNANTSNHLANGTFAEQFSSPNLPASWSKGGNVTITHSSESYDATGSVILEGGGAVGSTSGNWFFHNAGTAVFANHKRHKATVTFKRKTGNDVLQVALNYYRIGQTTESAVGNSGSGTTVFYNSSDGMGGNFAGSEFVSERLVSLGSSWFRYEVEFIAGGSVAATNQYLVLGTASDGDEFYIDNVTLQTVGEVAAYTPKTIDAQHSQSAKHKWLDATSNNNHGSISGCTPVGDNDHRGILRVHSNSDAGSAYAHQHLNGTINIGSNNNYQGRIDYNATGGTEFLIDNSYNSNSAKTQFGMKTAGTRLPVLELVGDGSVKATSAASDNLKQVARVHSQNITFNSTTSAIAFRVLHNLGTKYVTVSVCENATSSGQNAAHVETEVRLGDYVGADIGAVSSQQSNTDENYVTIIFAAHQGNNTAFKVTVIG